MATPDQDVFAEELSILNTDLKGIRVKPSPNTLPPGVPVHQVYSLPAFTPAQIATLRSEAQQVLTQERAARGMPAAGGVAVIPPDGRGVEAGQLYWLAAEKKGTIKFGDMVPNVADAPTDGAKAIHTLSDGHQIFVECVIGDKVDEFRSRPALWDNRVVSIEKDAMGRSETSLKTVAKKSEEVEMNWVLTGPRTARWCLAYLVTEDLGLEGHHERFRTLCKLDSSSWGIQEHYQLTMTLKYAIQNDQVNPYNNLFCEVIFRRLQTIEYAYMERAREQEAKAVGGRLSLEEQSTFGGITRAAATLMICPDLLSHVKTEVERDAALAKNLRKAREEREIARKGGKAGKKEEGAP